MNKLERKQMDERKKRLTNTRDNMLWIGLATPAETYPYPYPHQRHNVKKEKTLSYRTKAEDGWK